MTNFYHSAATIVFSLKLPRQIFSLIGEKENLSQGRFIIKRRFRLWGRNSRVKQSWGGEINFLLKENCTTLAGVNNNFFYKFTAKDDRKEDSIFIENFYVEKQGMKSECDARMESSCVATQHFLFSFSININNAAPFENCDKDQYFII